MSDYEKVMEYLRDECLKIRGIWDGDNPGKQEDDAHLATHLLELLEEVDLAVKELDL